MSSTPPPPEKCEKKVKWQSKQKHAFLEAYLKIWTDHVGKVGTEGPSLAIVDLHAAWGWCHDPESGKSPWEGTSVLGARYLRDYNAAAWKRMLILNTYHPEKQTQEEQRAALIDAINAENFPPGGKYEVISMPVAEAVEYAKQRVKPNFPSLWIVDPYQPEEVPWEVLESIITHEGTRPGRKKDTVETRRPELFINLMTASLQRNADMHPDLISTVLGLPEEAWRPTFDRYVNDEGMNKRDAIIEMFIDRLGQFYKKRPRHILVQGAEGNIIYAVIFCTDDDAGYYMMMKESIPKYQEWFEGKWKPTADAIAEERREERQEAKAEKERQETAKKHRSLLDY